MASPGSMGTPTTTAVVRRRQGGESEHGTRRQIPRRGAQLPPIALLETLSYGTRTGRMRVSVVGGTPYRPAPSGGGGGGEPLPVPGGGVEPTPSGGGGGGSGVERLIALHVSADTVGSSGSEEVRVSGPIGFDFCVRSVTVIPLGPVVAGQFVQVLVSAGGGEGEGALLEGSPVFEAGSPTASTPAADAQAGLAVPAEAITLPGTDRVYPGSYVLKAQTRFVAPAAGLPAVSVVVGVGVPAPVVVPGGVPVPVPVPEVPPSGGGGGGVPPSGGGSPGEVPPAPEPVLPWWATSVHFPLPAAEDRPRTLLPTGLWVPVTWPTVVRTVSPAEIAAGRAREYVFGTGLGYEYELWWSGSGYGARYLGPVSAGGGA